MIPSPWLDKTPTPSPTASFVEYLRWMRAPKQDYENPTKIQILQLALEKGNYLDRLTKLNERTRLIAGKDNHFDVVCTWRIRVGGHRGPENILLPSFDALGMPYIPSSTLRGVARKQAIQFFMDSESLKHEEAEEKAATYFGSLKTEKKDRAGKVIFLDAYPVANRDDKLGGLLLDMVNNIWSWNSDIVGRLQYDPNPNLFLSMQSTFCIGLRPTCNSTPEILREVRTWLIQGLANGIGSQINAGYGRITKKNKNHIDTSFLKVNFTLNGQLIHGAQEFRDLTQLYKKNRETGQYKRAKGKLVADTKPINEVRPIAFKSMLRYWFRAFALAYFSHSSVKSLEAKFFGTFDSKLRKKLSGKTGLIRFEIINGQNRSSISRQSPGQQQGQLVLSFSKDPQDERDHIIQAMKTLTWVMFHIGGVGLGARRPCYSREDSPDPIPFWRGSTLIASNTPKGWGYFETISEFHTLFQSKIRQFYIALGNLQNSQLKSQPHNFTDPRHQVVDKYSRIIVCNGLSHSLKPYALEVLHGEYLDDSGKAIRYHPQLCGSTDMDPVLPSPIWISTPSDAFQVVTVFEVNTAPRQEFIDRLKDGSYSDECLKIWPL